MKKHKISVIRVFIGVICGVLAVFLVFCISVVYRDINSPFKWKYKSQIIDVCADAYSSLNHIKIEAYGHGYRVSYKTATAGLVYNSALTDAIKVFNAVIDYTNEHEEHPMHGKDLTLHVVSDKYGISFGYVEISYCGGKTSVTAASSEINSSGYHDLSGLKYGVNDLILISNTIISIDPLLGLSDIDSLEFDHCCYISSTQAAPNDTDVQKLKEKFPDCVIKVDGKTIE